MFARVIINGPGIRNDNVIARIEKHSLAGLDMVMVAEMKPNSLSTWEEWFFEIPRYLNPGCVQEVFPFACMEDAREALREYWFPHDAKKNEKK